MEVNYQSVVLRRVENNKLQKRNFRPRPKQQFDRLVQEVRVLEGYYQEATQEYNLLRTLSRKQDQQLKQSMDLPRLQRAKCCFR